MQLRLPVLLFLALVLAPSRAEAASEAEQLFHGMLPSNDVLNAFQRCTGTLEGKDGYALTEQLDQLVASTEYAQLLAWAAHVVRDDLGLDEITDAAVEREFMRFVARLASPHLRHLANRAHNAIIATLEVVPNQKLVEWASELENPRMMLDMIDMVTSPNEPAELRRHLRHILRGQAALMCAPFASKSLQHELLTHAALGTETSLRIAAALSDDQARARTILADLRLDPIDLQRLMARQEQLHTARESLREARAELPGFRLPPEPGLEH